MKVYIFSSRMGNFSLYQQYGVNTFFALRNGSNGSNIDGVTEMIVITEKAKPLWKQAMDMQMGKPVRNQIDRRLIRLVPINPTDFPRGITYEVYECFYY